MRSLRLYRMSVYFVAFAGTLGLAPVEGNLLSPLLFLGISIPFWWARNRAGTLPPQTQRGTVILNTLLAAAALLLIVLETPLIAWFHISVILQAYTFFTARKSCSYILVYLIAMVQVLVACFLRVPPHTLIILFYLLTMTVFSLLLHYLMGGMRARVQAMREPDPREDPLENEFSSLKRVNRFFFMSSGATATVLLLGGALFFLLPRGAGPPETAADSARETPGRRGRGLPEDPDLPWKWPKPGDFSNSGTGGGADGPVHSGFSGEIDLGNWGILFESEREVLRVLLSRAREYALPDLADFYLKGVVLDRFDGRRWTRGRTALRRFSDAGDGKRDGIVTFDEFDEMDSDILLQYITARREFGPIRFHVHTPVGFMGRQVYRDANGALWARKSGFSDDEVEAYSVFSRPVSTSRRFRMKLEKSASTSPHPRYLALPPGMGRVKGLARRIHDPGLSSWVNAWKMIEYLEKQCRYSKKAYTPPAGASPLDVFLFRRRAGHCELFASALAVMLRAVGIPSRVVGGFRGGAIRSELDASYIAIRESNAHAWVEVWFDDAKNWVRLDPTPGSFLDDETEDTLSLEGKTEEKPPDDLFGFLLKYDRGRQRRFLGGIAGGAGSGLKSIGGFAWNLFRAIPLPILAALAAGVATLVAVLARRRRRHEEAVRVLGKHAGRQHRKSLTFYVELLKALRNLGYFRAPSQTPAEFAAAVTSADASLGGVGLVTDLFHRIRYREEIPPRADLMKAFAVVRDIKRRERPKKKSKVQSRKSKV